VEELPPSDHCFPNLEFNNNQSINEDKMSKEFENKLAHYREIVIEKYKIPSSNLLTGTIIIRTITFVTKSV